MHPLYSTYKQRSWSAWSSKRNQGMTLGYILFPVERSPSAGRPTCRKHISPANRKRSDRRPAQFQRIVAYRTFAGRPLMGSSSLEPHGHLNGHHNGANGHIEQTPNGTEAMVTQTAVRRVLTKATLSPALLSTSYAVRGPLAILADQLQTDLAKAQAKGKEAEEQLIRKRGWKNVVSTNIGNPQALGQVPITFFRQVGRRPETVEADRGRFERVYPGSRIFWNVAVLSASATIAGVWYQFGVSRPMTGIKSLLA